MTEMVSKNRTEAPRWLAPKQLFDGSKLRAQMALRIDNGLIAEIQPLSNLPPDANINHFDAIFSPGFFDIQINGGGDVLFNTDVSDAGLARIIAAHAAGGTLHWLPTVITDAPEVMDRACAAILAYHTKHGVAGIHIEGPHIAIARKGTHKTAWIRRFSPATLENVRALRQADIPVLITVAPEAMHPGDIRALVATGARVSLGHTDATEAEINQALAEGASLFTHLFNAMSQMTNREPGAVGSAIASQAYCSIIVDGHHVSDTMVAVALRARPVADRMILITDAMPTVGGSDSFNLYGNVIHLKNGRLVNSEGALAGAHVTMIQALARLVNVIGLPLEEALKMATSTPARAMGLDNHIGHIRPGSKAEVLTIAPDLSRVEILHRISL